ncbi:hypothetical protein Pyrde_0913 [Pyrodictium delaneyi]|nr:hypothetical protein Pyrde_0913 [Pyrodictium delaneyi]
MREYAASIYRLASGFLEARRRLIATLEGRELAELVDDEHTVEMLLGGFKPERRGQRYPPRSLARFYRDVIGVYIQQPERLAARLRDGLPLSIASRGIRVAASKTRPVSQIEALRDAARALLESLGTDASEPQEVDTNDPMWAPELVRQLLSAIVDGMPPYSRKALVLYSAWSITAALLEKIAEKDERRELEELGLEEYARFFGADVDPLRIVYRAQPGSPLARYRCLVHAGARLLQLSELEAFYKKPDPVKDMLQAAMRHVSRASKELRELLDLMASNASQRSQCLPRAECPGEPPCLPLGAVWAELDVEVEDTLAKLGKGVEAGVGELLSALSPLMIYGLAIIEKRYDGGDKGLIRIAFVAEQKPPRDKAG